MDRRSDPLEKADGITIRKNIDMRANMTLLIDYAVKHSLRSSPERSQSVPYRRA
jgi:hypothetical protein